MVVAVVAVPIEVVLVILILVVMELLLHLLQLHFSPHYLDLLHRFLHLPIQTLHHLHPLIISRHHHHHHQHHRHTHLHHPSLLPLLLLLINIIGIFLPPRLEVLVSGSRQASGSAEENAML